MDGHLLAVLIAGFLFGFIACGFWRGRDRYDSPVETCIERSGVNKAYAGPKRDCTKRA